MSGLSIVLERIGLLLIAVTTGVTSYERLPSEIVHPISYRLHIRPIMEGNFTYTGELALQLMMNNTNMFWLDCDPDLTMEKSTMMFDEGFAVPHNITTNTNGSRLLVQTGYMMKPNYDVRFTVTFTGRLRTDRSGFYLSEYNNNGTKRRMASTHFESSAARKAFPCFDEPAFRAKFLLEVSLDPGWRAISNTPIASENTTNYGGLALRVRYECHLLTDYRTTLKNKALERTGNWPLDEHFIFTNLFNDFKLFVKKDGLTKITYTEMPSTPVYLTAWVVYQEAGYGGSDKPITTDQSECSSPTTYNVWSRKDFISKELGMLALKSAPALVSEYEKFTGISCKAVINKMDLVAIPDFQAGAMENWGLITFRESALLYDMFFGNMTKSYQNTLMIVSHELAHQWFGNLVTPNWWSYTWLSEGFARYLQYFITHKLYPELQLDKQFLLDRRQTVLVKDSPEEHPLTNELLETIADLEDNFDEITYDKGAAIIHMFKSVLGEEEFKKGINTYLTSVTEAGKGVTSPNWFFNAFPRLAELRQWTETSGYPILVITEEEQSIDIKQVKITDWNQTTISNWTVPVSIRINGNISWHYLKPDNESLKISLNWTNVPSYFINVNQTGYYRVLYSNHNRYDQRTSEYERSALVDDVMALAYAGLLPYSTAIPITINHLLANYTDYYVWTAGMKALEKIMSIVKGSNQTEYKTNFTAIIKDIFNKAYNIMRDEHNQSTITQALHQMNIIKYACNYGIEKCLEDARALNLDIRSYNARDMRKAALLCPAVRIGSSSTWEEVWQKYLLAKTPTEAQMYLQALTCTHDRSLIKRFLGLLFTDDVKKHDVKGLISLLCSNRAGIEEFISFIRANYDKIYNYFGEMRTIRSILSSIVINFNQTELEEVKAYSRILNFDSAIYKSQKLSSWRNKVNDQLKMVVLNITIPDNEPVDGDNSTVPEPTSTTPTVLGNSNRLDPSHAITFGLAILLSIFSLVKNISTSII